MSLIRNPVALVTIAVVVTLVVYGAYLIESEPGPVTNGVPTKFTVNGKTFVFTYIATTEAEREAGLMNRRITNGTTELFAFPSFGAWQFYMFNTNTSLDMIWVNATGSSARVVYIVSGAQPCYDFNACPRFTPTASANYVIEAKAGFAATNGIAVGTPIVFST